jgi:hypothetical protein
MLRRRGKQLAMRIARAEVLLGLLLLVAVSGLGIALATQDRLSDFKEFLLDRREGLGQTQPDRSATCLYNLEADQTLHITRKAHAQTVKHTITLADTIVEPFFAGQEAAIETTTTLDTYNCTNGEYLSHKINGDKGNPVAGVFFSTSGRNLAVTINKEKKIGAVEVFKFKVDLGKSIWNEGFGPKKAGLQERIDRVAMVGESLVVVANQDGRTRIHTYNFRSSHKENPWNAHSKGHAPLVFTGQLVDEPKFTNRGRVVELRERSGVKEAIWQYDFTCKLKAPEGQAENPKPCTWVQK